MAAVTATVAEILPLPHSSVDLPSWMQQMSERMEQVLLAHLPAVPALQTQDAALDDLHAAMQYAVLQGGKRVRPLLVFAAGELVQAPFAALQAPAVALELIHAYSLVHDDMPCMDNDLLRRGKPTVHVQFGEANALLVGDALQTLAFQVLADSTALSATQKVALVAQLARASGSYGMAGGQAIDLAHVGQPMQQAALQDMHSRKTGALLVASVMLGAICGQSGLAVAQSQSLLQFAQTIGLAFQVADDVLDATASTAALGKTAGKDAAANKPTYVSLLGLAAARDYAETLYQQALQHLAGWGAEANRLRQLARYIVYRQS